MWLKTRALEIKKDDELLNSEGIHELSFRELQIANVRRGLDPTKDYDTLKGQLLEWLKKGEKRKNISVLIQDSAGIYVHK